MRGFGRKRATSISMATDGVWIDSPEKSLFLDPIGTCLVRLAPTSLINDRVARQNQRGARSLG